MTLKRAGETDEQAFERIKDSTYVTAFKHDEYWPFYHIDFQFGKIILTINTAHPFYTKLYDPIAQLSPSDKNDDHDGAEEGEDGNDSIPSEILVALQMLLFSSAAPRARWISIARIPSAPSCSKTFAMNGRRT